MFCANCGTQSGGDDVFCGNCGADLRQQPRPGAQPAAVQPQQPVAVQPPPEVATPAARPASRKTLWIVLGVAGAVLVLLVAVGVGGLLWYRSSSGTATQTEQMPSVEESATPTASGATTYPDPEAALKSELPKGWVFQLVGDTPQQKEYWGGPPASEFTTVYLIEPEGDGWAIVDAYPLEQGGDVAPEDEAAGVVDQFLADIQADKADEAHSLTVEPFAADPASAQYSDGMFKSYTIDSVEAAADGTFFVVTTQEWEGAGTERWRYRVVVTEDGMRISELMPAP